MNEEEDSPLPPQLIPATSSEDMDEEEGQDTPSYFSGTMHVKAQDYSLQVLALSTTGPLPQDCS
ncbi:unnamed protein product [Cyprideis torosa]|uniref:Uncharacterized protein n=1 Tax=Cyprideis torosa TaxID=163714 RepID=A0A7R8X246_9CRUS|nr:unnamed protein product [Cyprideis torosa]CAG0910684.1 unnamed protein product [Cyprideis torosa]